ncbi:MAG: beta-propeller fold lactonase family protein [Planctomycetota bacterium]
MKKIENVATASGGGPRHMKFHPNKKWVYVLNELSMTVSCFHYDSENMSFKKFQDIQSLPDELKDNRLNSAAEIRIHPNGEYLYTSNRGHDSITVFAIDTQDGRLEFVERESIRGSWPRNFDIDPSGKYLIAAGKYSNTLSLFDIEDDGRLSFTRKMVDLPRPICVAIQKKQ